ncbi:TetR/AcrR family transcriptional regulator [Colwellia sp. 1_MG-2023]|uniref:TetR/AcrR family transcriptional regulator n=1 Tax=Colwellia sp. 1_MG-2023 TaxID=3062649 RepID=UPI0026E25E46|nr:TetR/AcrR family transcriptional regulator [Colwellia sp. 1_MG-2023]MDO6444803.1 TetR/AcrR family transcriptional regulator [Colwellia sp. 1_MG-2023]
MSNTPSSKRELILATAKALFIEKGFRGTTIAGIAEDAGIAKGSVYSYFTGKLDIVKALFIQTDEKSQQAVNNLLTKNQTTGSELLEQYLICEFQEVLNERSFIQMFLTDESIVMDTDIMAVLKECRINYHLSQQKVLINAYGDSITPWIYDIVSLVNGLLQEYSIYLTLDDANFSIKRCAHLISFVVDSAIKALNTSNLSPLITKDNFPLTQNVDLENLQRQKASDILDNIKNHLTDFNEQQKTSVLETVTLIEAELTKADLSNTLIRALIANLRPYAELNHYRRRLAETLDVELI